jgi:hypothetical protein
MVKKNIVLMSLAIAFNLFIISFISSSISLGNASANQSYSISTVYSPNETLNGWINISIANETTDSLIKMSISGGSLSFSKSIKLIDLLKKPVNSQVNYSCSYLNCDDIYTTSNPATSKSKIIETDEKQDNLFAFVITSPSNSLLTEVSSFSLNVNSNNDKSVITPLKIDLLNNGVIDWQSEKGTRDEYGDEDYGCFESDEADDYAIFDNTSNYYCNTMEFEEHPGLMLGAKVIGSKNNALFNLTIINQDGTRTASCLATTSGEENIFCNVSYITLKDEQYHICVNPRNENATKYKIRYETNNNPCGYSIISNGLNQGFDFEIYVRPQKYDSIGSFVLNSSSIKKFNPEITSAELLIKDYIEKEYSNNCSKGCIIPINFITNKNQTIDLSSLNLAFKIGVLTNTNNIYNALLIPSDITTSSFQKVYLNDIGFNTPLTQTSKNYTLKIYFNNRLLFSKLISVLINNDILSWIYPEIVPLNYSTSFELGLNSTKGLNYFEWDFGDGSEKQITNIPKVVHRYSSLGNYTISIKAKDSSNKEYSNSFKIQVISPKTFLPELFSEKERKLNEIVSSINGFSLNNFEKSKIYEILNLNKSLSVISFIRPKLNSTITDEESIIYLNNISSLNIPDKIYIKEKTQSPITVYPVKGDINPGLIDESYNESLIQEYQDAIYNWQLTNKKISLTFKSINQMTDNQDYGLMKFFTLDIENLNENASSSKLILKKYDNMVFDRNLSYQEKSGYFIIDLPPETTTLTFMTTQTDVSPLNFKAIISPSLSELDVGEITPAEIKDNTPLIIILSSVVVVLGIITWVILARWYKNKYEKHLFKDQNQLYNLVLFIEAERKRGKKESEIKDELRKVGWTNEQIRYASRKHSNKNTGMPLSQ